MSKTVKQVLSNSDKQMETIKFVKMIATWEIGELNIAKTDIEQSCSTDDCTEGSDKSSRSGQSLRHIDRFPLDYVMMQVLELGDQIWRHFHSNFVYNFLSFLWWISPNLQLTIVEFGRHVFRQIFVLFGRHFWWLDHLKLNVPSGFVIDLNVTGLGASEAVLTFRSAVSSLDASEKSEKETSSFISCRSLSSSSSSISTSNPVVAVKLSIGVGCTAKMIHRELGHFTDFSRCYLGMEALSGRFWSPSGNKQTKDCAIRDKPMSRTAQSCPICRYPDIAVQEWSTLHRASPFKSQFSLISMIHLIHPSFPGRRKNQAIRKTASWWSNWPEWSAINQLIHFHF